MKLEKKMAGNKAINSALQELQHVGAGRGERRIQTYTPTLEFALFFFSPEI